MESAWLGPAGSTAGLKHLQGLPHMPVLGCLSSPPRGLSFHMAPITLVCPGCCAWQLASKRERESRRPRAFKARPGTGRVTSAIFSLSKKVTGPVEIQGGGGVGWGGGGVAGEGGGGTGLLSGSSILCVQVGRNSRQLPLEKMYHPTSQDFRKESQEDMAPGHKD